MEQKNLILAIVISVSILLSWQILVEGPRIEKERAAQEAAKAQQQATQQTAPAAPGAPVPGAPGTPTVPPQPGAAPTTSPGGVPIAGVPTAAVPPKREDVIAREQRIALKSERLVGSIATTGARIDDLILTQYRETVEKDSAQITLLSPPGAQNPYFARFGWAPHGNGIAVPGDNTPWTADRRELSPGAPVTLTWDNGQGLVFTQVIAMDENYMFTVTQRVTNRSDKQVTLSPYGLVSRTGTPDTIDFYILHEGMIGVFGDALSEYDYSDLQDEGKISKKSKGGWIGITDKYWLAALVPNQKSDVNYRFTHSTVNKQDKYQVDYLDNALTVAPGRSIESTNRLFAGAKVVRMLDAYRDDLNIPAFDKAVDFGWFYWLTKPIFYALEYFNRLVGNFGVAILLLTVCIKIVFFPLANKSYKSMSRLKLLAPKMKEIQERFKDDRARQQQEMMALYKKENANPMSGCLPILIQIPVFFALYKVLFVTIEMRHAPFFGWIQDLSAQDPLGLLTAFGLIDWNVPQILDVANIGIWPILMGMTMYLQQKLNPQPTDPMQAKIFMFLPIIFTFLLGQFPAGLVIYWAWNNLLSIAQQWVIMRRMGVSASGQQIPPAGGGAAKAGGTAAAGAAAAGASGSSAKRKAKGNGAQGGTSAEKRARRANGSTPNRKSKRRRKNQGSGDRPGAR